MNIYLRARQDEYVDRGRLHPIADGFVNPGPELSETCRAMCGMLTACVLDNPTSTSKQKQKVMEIARDAVKFGLPMLSMFPALVSTERHLIEELESELQLNLTSSTRGTVKTATGVMHHWLDQIGREGMPLPSESLLLTTAGRLSSQDGEILPAALRLCTKIARTMPKRRLRRFLKHVCCEVERLIPQIGYTKENASSWDHDEQLLAADIPDIRTGVVGLILALQQGDFGNETLYGFLQEARNDCLPEVRRAGCGE